MKTVMIENRTHPLRSPLVVPYCASFFCRLRGLMFRKTLLAGEGLLLVDKRDSVIDSSIHMMFVNFNLAVAWINQQGIVVDTVLARKWRPAYFPKKPARFVLEMTEDRLVEFHEGDQVLFNEVFLDR